MSQPQTHPDASARHAMLANLQTERGEKADSEKSEKAPVNRKK